MEHLDENMKTKETIKTILFLSLIIFLITFVILSITNPNNECGFFERGPCFVEHQINYVIPDDIELVKINILNVPENMMVVPFGKQVDNNTINITFYGCVGLSYDECDKLIGENK